MKTLRLVYALLVTLAAASVALAAANAHAEDPAESLMSDFVSAPGYEPLDVAELDAMIEAGLPATDSVFTAGGQLGPLAKAVHALEAVDGHLERARYQLTVTLVAASESPAADPVPVLLVQLDRFNLGPAVHEELVQSLGEDNVADVAEFGVGPHVSWRLVIRQLMGQQSAIMAAARAELDVVEAGSPACLAVSCLQTTGSIEDAASWGEMQQVAPDPDVDALEPAALLELLAEMAGFDPYAHEALWGASATAPVIAHALVETNLAQELYSEGALRVGELLDDSVSAVWHRLLVLNSADGGSVLYAAEAFECRRGETADGLCL